MLIVGNGRLITRDSKNLYMEDGSVVIEGNKILEIGSTENIKKKYSTEEYIDANGKVIMPGMINTHNHIYSSFATGMPSKESKNFVEILENLWWKIDKKLTLEDVKYSALNTYLECIKNGTTTIFDHHASQGAVTDSLFTIAEVAKKMNVRSNLCYEVTDRDGKEIMEQAINENVNFIKHANSLNDDMLKGMFGLHASMTLSNDTMQKCAKAISDLEAGFHVHVAEGIADVYDSLNKYGKRVVERFNDFGMLNEKTIAVHGIHTNKREMDILRDTNTMVVHNSESNMGNAVGCAPVIEMLKNDILVGLGTDGFTSDMFESMKVANLLQKHNLCDPRIAWGEVPTMIFENNRKIANRYIESPIGIIKEGALADIIIVDYIPHTPFNEDTFDSHILFKFMGRSVDTTIINGKVVMKDREVLVVDEEEILSKSRELSSKLWSRV
ncbi:putative aminohydrolase SsnA [Clostridium sp. D2Q-14]|uniref:putative aminohydrolase SsnA n=1 Tax=Anaeromonas gelatinilytica TaxID=2683194 RepID=UPI00193B1F6E|nr:putative aminohydrolase SsnA [Anaeromonas gelatinilytica]MBS4535233.1 putative aminohydrolase SsnA [Anaeromonas gelatinilytica]